jgi:hypothetical protein
MSTETLLGMSGSADLSTSRWSAAVPSAFVSILDTCPTCTPRIFTLASGFITRPARSEITVTGTVLAQDPRNRLTASATIRPRVTINANPVSGRTTLLFIDAP